MIRINLLGRIRPKAPAKPVEVAGAGRVFILIAAIVIGFAYLLWAYHEDSVQLDKVNQEITRLQAEKASLQLIKQQVEQFEKQKSTLQQRIDVIRTLQRNRTGGQELLQMVATTVIKTDELWLTLLKRTSNALDIEGDAASINAVANFITQLKRSGYFGKVEIKEAKETTGQALPVPVFHFVMTAEAGGSSTQATATATTAPATAPAKGGS